MALRRRKPMNGLDALKSALGARKERDDDETEDEPEKPVVTGGAVRGASPAEEARRAPPQPQREEPAHLPAATKPPAEQSQPKPRLPQIEPVSPPKPSFAARDERTRPSETSPPAVPDRGAVRPPAGRIAPAPDGSAADGKRASENRSIVGRKEEMAENIRKTQEPVQSRELAPIQESLEGVFKEQAEAASGAAGRVISNLKEAGEILDRQYRKIIDMLRANELLTRDAGRINESVKKRRELKTSIEEAITELSSANEQLDKNYQRLVSEKDGLLSEKEKATGENDELIASIREFTEDISSLQKESEDLTGETAKLEKERDRLEEDVRRLSRLKEEYLANVARFREGEGEGG